MFKNEIFTGNLKDMFVDPDGPVTGLNFTVNTTAQHILVTWVNTTHAITINPQTNWTGVTSFTVNATDGIDFAVYTMIVEVSLHTYKISGTVTFEDAATHLVGVSNDSKVATLTFGTHAVTTDNVTFSYEITLDEGEYAVSIALNLPVNKTYNAATLRSGYVVPTIANVTMTADRTLDIVVEWQDAVEAATWADLDFEGAVIDDLGDSEFEITLEPLEASKDKAGFEDLTVYFVIRNEEDKDDDNIRFLMTWDETKGAFFLALDKDDLKNVSEGKLQYYFSDGDGQMSDVSEYEFNEKDENADIITVIVLIVLIVLVLIALVFIMRKPSEEGEAEKEEEGEEESEEKKCPGCGEAITEEDAEECPYCGESLEE
jgi:hypothetical protein